VAPTPPLAQRSPVGFSETRYTSNETVFPSALIEPRPDQLIVLLPLNASTSKHVPLPCTLLIATESEVDPLLEMAVLSQVPVEPAVVAPFNVPTK
jgi:hypothetical protein